MLLDETFHISLKGSRRWRIKALAAMAIIGLVCSLATLQPAKTTADQRMSRQWNRHLGGLRCRTAR